MDDKRERDKEIYQAEKKGRLGCLAQAAILILVLISIPVFYFVYNIAIKESALETSSSPNAVNTVEVVQKGEAMMFSPSSVRIKYGGKYKDSSVGNDGKTLDSSNVTISWEDDSKAVVTLYGEEQSPETITINFE